MDRVNIRDVGGKTIKDNAQYVLKDNAFGKNLVLSSTMLRANQSTNGHTHAGQEEVYMFTKGSGKMQLDDKTFYVKEGDIVLIEDGVFHKVFSGPHGMEFICVFDGRRSY